MIHNKGMHEIGLTIARVLYLEQRYRGDVVSFETEWGFKTPEGLYHTLNRIMREGEKKYNISDKEINYYFVQHHQDLVKDTHKPLESNPLNYELLLQKGQELRSKGRQGTPIYMFGQIRNECWNCLNYCKETDPKGDKGYYICEYCGAYMHK